MEEKKQDKVMIFDTLFTNHHIQLLKVFLPYLELPMQKNLAIYIKYLELDYTMQFFRHFSNLSLSPLNRETPPETADLIPLLLPYCSSEEAKTLKHIQNTFQSFSNIKDMLETIELLKELMPESSDTDSFSENILSSFFETSDAKEMNPNMLIQLIQSMSSKE